MLVYDVSEFDLDDHVQELIDHGADGFALRLGETIYGEPLIDEKFIKFVNQVVAAGFPYGVYYVSHAENERMFQMEAWWIHDKVVNLLNGREPELGIWWGMKSAAVKYRGITRGLLGTIEMMRSWWGNTDKIGVYAGYSYFDRYLDLNLLVDHQTPIWVIQHNRHENKLIIEYPELRLVAWQSVTNDVSQDVNEWYGF
jgi:hypothetical protein